MDNWRCDTPNLLHIEINYNKIQDLRKTGHISAETDFVTYFSVKSDSLKSLTHTLQSYRMKEKRKESSKMK